MKTGRNDPCPCGSGRKYKQCCLAAEQARANTPEVQAWRRIRQELDGFVGRMMGFVHSHYGDGAVDDAWDEFIQDDDTELEEYDEHMPVFGPWLFHNWAPDCGSPWLRDRGLAGVSPTDAFLSQPSSRISRVLREYLQSCLDRPFSFYEVEASTPGVGFRVRDLLTDAVADVLERSASNTLREGDVIYAKLVHAQGVTLAEAIGPTTLQSARLDLVDLREHMRRQAGASPGDRDLELHAEELRELYLGHTAAALNPRMPELRNSDGDALEWHTLEYDIDDAEAVIDALADLCTTQTRDEILTDATLQDGRVHSVEFPWTRDNGPGDAIGSNTVLGHLHIDGSQVTVRLNSRARSDTFKTIASHRLGRLARLRADHVEDMDEMLDALPTEREVQDLLAADLDPELQAVTATLLEQHYASWPDMRLPALGNRTPREAVKDPLGRQKVDALLRQMAYHAGGARLSPGANQWERMRKDLGLDPA